jgi:hypothetical protein
MPLYQYNIWHSLSAVGYCCAHVSAVHVQGYKEELISKLINQTCAVSNVNISLIVLINVQQPILNLSLQPYLMKMMCALHLWRAFWCHLLLCS